jgi:hypothetical protein
MEHIQHLSFKSLVKMDHFQKKPPLDPAAPDEDAQIIQ